MRKLLFLLVIAIVGCTNDVVIDEPLVSPPRAGSLFTFRIGENSIKTRTDTVIMSGVEKSGLTNVNWIRRGDGENIYISCDKNGDIHIVSGAQSRDWKLYPFGSRPETHKRDSTYSEGYGYYLTKQDTVYRDTLISINGASFDAVKQEVAWWGETHPINAEVIELGSYTDYSLWVPALGMFGREETRISLSQNPVTVLDSYVLK